MLENIVNSKTDSAVLSFLLSAPPRAFSVLELSKRLDIAFLNTAHSLGKLSLNGPVASFTKRGKKYYMLNQHYKLLPGIKDYWRKTGAKYQDELFSAIKKLGDIKAAFLSGLFSGQPNLTVDILLVGRVNLRKLDEFLKAAEHMMGQEINYSVMGVNEFVQRRDTYDRFIKDIFDYQHLTVVDTLQNKTN